MLTLSGNMQQKILRRCVLFELLNPFGFLIRTLIAQSVIGQFVMGQYVSFCVGCKRAVALGFLFSFTSFVLNYQEQRKVAK